MALLALLARLNIITIIILFVELVILVYANAMPSREEGNLKPPEELNVLLKGLFYRGWPVSPWMACLYHGGKWHPEQSFIWWPLIIDGFVACASLIITGCIVELLLRQLNIKRLNIGHK